MENAALLALLYLAGALAPGCPLVHFAPAGDMAQVKRGVTTHSCVQMVDQGWHLLCCACPARFRSWERSPAVPFSSYALPTPPMLLQVPHAFVTEHEIKAAAAAVAGEAERQKQEIERQASRCAAAAEHLPLAGWLLF